MGHELDSTINSFPPYADLAKTQAWAGNVGYVETLDLLEVSQASRYTEGAELGVGGMGRVILARDARIGRDVAVKVLHADRELEPSERARFLREAQVQGQLEHPSIVPVYDIDRRADGTTFFTMRRVLGRTLAQIIDDLRKGVPAAKARYTQRELLTAFATVCLTIDYAHSRGVVHRDLKPANIMLGDFGEVYVLDWGLARLVDEKGQAAPEDGPQERISMPGEFLGTPMYMAPEQMANPDVGPSADVFSLGLILYEILTLERARDPNALFAPIDARTSVRAPYRNVAPELETICVRATAFEEKDRYPAARALQEAINRYLEGDRELEQRRQLAAKHMETARTALASDDDKTRSTAVTELGRAVALDPGNTEYLKLLGELMSTPPARIPDDVRTQIDAENQNVVHVGAKHSISSMLSWWLFLPVLVWIGFHTAWQALVIAVPTIGATLAGVIMYKQKRVGTTIQLVSICLTMLAGMAISRIYGPFILLPSLITTYAIVLQAHPQHRMRMTGAIAAAIAIVVPAVLEWLGALPASYVFEHNAWTIVPQLVELPRLGTNVFLTVAHLGMIVVPCLFIAKLREELNRAQLRLAVQAWQWKRVISSTHAGMP